LTLTISCQIIMAHEQQQARDKDRITRLEARLQGVDEDLRRAQQQYADVRTPAPPRTCLAGLMAVVAQTAQELEECRMQLRDSERVRLPLRRGGGLLTRFGGQAREKQKTDLEISTTRLQSLQTEVRCL
jgi:hypothetical protein